MDFNINNMKKLITLALLMCTITLVKSQNNLVFNQTINSSLSINQEITVPDGKIWKIEFVNINDPNSTNSFYIETPNSSGGYTTNRVYMSGNTLSAAHLIWLKAGSRVKSGSESLFLSALEFNVVPTSSSVTSNSGYTGVSSHSDTYYSIEEFIVSPDGYDGGIKDLNSITVPEGQIWKIIYGFMHRYSQENVFQSADGYVFFDEMLFKDDSRDGFWLESGVHKVNTRPTSQFEKNKIIIKALIYDIN